MAENRGFQWRPAPRPPTLKAMPDRRLWARWQAIRAALLPIEAHVARYPLDRRASRLLDCLGREYDRAALRLHRRARARMTDAEAAAFAAALAPFAAELLRDWSRDPATGAWRYAPVAEVADQLLADATGAVQADAEDEGAP